MQPYVRCVALRPCWFKFSFEEHLREHSDSEVPYILLDMGPYSFSSFGYLVSVKPKTLKIALSMLPQMPCIVHVLSYEAFRVLRMTPSLLMLPWLLELLPFLKCLS